MPLSINEFREKKGGNPDKVRESIAKRGGDVALVDQIIAADEKWTALTFQRDELRKEANKIAKGIGKLMKEGKKEEALAAKEQARAAKQQVEEAEKVIAVTKKEVDGLIYRVGNFVHDSVPVHQSEHCNTIVKTFGQCKKVTGPGQHHHELLYRIDGYDSPRGVVVAGHRGYFLKGVGVMLNQALINYGLNFLMKREYTPLQPPYFMNKDVMAETAQLEQFDEELYKVVAGDDEKYLIATSEQPISAFHRREWISPADLPIRYGGLSTCFRKEAGSHGKDTWGIFRIHQFEKIEQFCITDPESSWDMHEEMIRVAEDFYAGLGLPYRVVNIVSGELNNAAAKKYDLEAWFPTLGVYRELVSSSNCTDYQSRAMETRFGQKKMGDRKKEYVHMLNATLCATERTICCILENYQTDEGVVVPEVLRPYMGGMEIMPFKKELPKKKAKAGKGKKGKNKN